jgi:inner membrane protein
MQKHFWIKIVLIATLIVLLLIPLGMIDGLIHERSYRQQEVVADIAASSAGSQHLFGPVLVVPYTERWTEAIETGTGSDKKKESFDRSEDQLLYFLPDQLNVEASLATETKRRGLFKVRSYVSDTQVHGSFKLPQNYGSPQPRHKGRIEFGSPYAAMAIADMRGVLETSPLEWNGQELGFEQGAALPVENVSGMHADLPPQPVAEGPAALPFRFSLKLRGLEQLEFIPAGKQTRVALTSSWPHPSYYGRFLPDPASQETGPQGFHADWAVNALASNVAAGLGSCREIRCFDAFGVRLMDPINIYSLSDRASKYAFLFVCLSFGAIFLFEVLKRLAVHPAQYALVGLALAMFFLLLLSLSEHIEFSLAYAIATAACTGLIGYYLSAVLASARRGLAAGAMLAGLFAALYGLLQSEDNSLVLGSVLLFALLALTMVATRRVDWYRLTAPYTVAAAPKTSP